MKTISISLPNAKKAFNDADAKGKTLLKNLLGEDVFNGKITDLVKTYEDACELLSLDPTKILPWTQPQDDEQIADNAFRKLVTIAKALNEGWKPDWTNNNEWKYWPWFKVSASGVGFSCSRYVTSRADTSLGSRLCYKTSELAEYAGTQFEAIYNEFLTLK
jgi:hypothetical protein